MHSSFFPCFLSPTPLSHPLVLTGIVYHVPLPVPPSLTSGKIFFVPFGLRASFFFFPLVERLFEKGRVVFCPSFQRFFFSHDRNLLSPPLQHGSVIRSPSLREFSFRGLFLTFSPQMAEVFICFTSNAPTVPTSHKGYGFFFHLVSAFQFFHHPPTPCFKPYRRHICGEACSDFFGCPVSDPSD